MKKDYAWTEEEYIKMAMDTRMIPGGMPARTVIFSVILAILGIFWLNRGLLHGVEIVLSLFDDQNVSSYWFLLYGTDLVFCVLELGLTFFCFYSIFTWSKQNARRQFRQNPEEILGPHTVETEGNCIRFTYLKSRSEWILDSSVTVFVSEFFIYAATGVNGKMKALLWVFPKRVFEEGEEALFLEYIGQYCEVKTLRTGPGIVRKADHIVLTVGVGLQILLFSLNLVSLQEMPGRWSFNYWIWSVILAIPCLLAYLYAAVRLYQSGKETVYKRFATVNLVVTAAAALLFLPVGGSSEFAYFWSAFLGIVFGLQIRALWLTAAGSGTVPRTFKRSLSIIALVNLGIALLCLVIFLFSLPGAGLTLRTFCENIPDPMSTDPNAKDASDAVYACAAHWVHGMIAVCCTCMSLLIESVVLAFREKKALPRLVLIIAATALLFFCRWCKSPLEFILWTVTLCGLFALCLRDVIIKKK